MNESFEATCLLNVHIGRGNSTKMIRWIYIGVVCLSYRKSHLHLHSTAKLTQTISDMNINKMFRLILIILVTWFTFAG